jgi:hypothetical protein
MEVSEAKKLRELERENTELKKRVAEKASRWAENDFV